MNAYLEELRIKELRRKEKQNNLFNSVIKISKKIKKENEVKQEIKQDSKGNDTFSKDTGNIESSMLLVDKSGNTEKLEKLEKIEKVEKVLDRTDKTDKNDNTLNKDSKENDTSMSDKEKEKEFGSHEDLDVNLILSKFMTLFGIEEDKSADLKNMKRSDHQ